MEKNVSIVYHKNVFGIITDQYLSYIKKFSLHNKFLIILTLEVACLKEFLYYYLLPIYYMPDR